MRFPSVLRITAVDKSDYTGVCGKLGGVALLFSVSKIGGS